MTKDAHLAHFFVAMVNALASQHPTIQSEIEKNLRCLPTLEEMTKTLAMVKRIQGQDLPSPQSLENEARLYLGMSQKP